MGLSGAQKNAISSSWKTLAPDTKTMTNNGAILFNLLFSAHPDAWDQHFKHMAGQSKDLNASGVGRAHAMAVMSGIGTFVTCLEDQECVDGLAKKLARNHLERNIGAARFQQLREVYGAFLEKALGGGASGDVKAAWDTFLGYLQDVLATEEKKK